MSEKEKSGGGAESSLVLVEKSTVSRHKQPFRPIDMQEDTTSELHKRSKAPAVPSVADDLKQSVHTDIKERKESKSSETHLHSASKKISSTKKRSSLPEPIALTPMPIEAKRSIIAPSQPIPAQVSSASSVTPDQTANKNDEDSREEEDSLTGEITELRTPEVTKKSAEWVDDSGDSNKKEVTWNEESYLDKVKLDFQDSLSRSQPNILEHKTSIGPCFRSVTPCGRPSGITISLSKKFPAIHEERIGQKSVINITVSKKCLINKTIHRTVNECNFTLKEPNDEIHNKGHFWSLRQRFSSMGVKIRNVFA